MRRGHAIGGEATSPSESRSRYGVLVLILLALAGRTAGQAASAQAPSSSPDASTAPATSPAPAPPPASAPTDSPSPAPDLAPGELARAIERAVARVLEEERDPCAHAKRDGKPCFPASVAREGPTVSVSEDLKKWRANPDRNPESRIIRSPAGTPLGGVGFDPVCAGRFLFRKLKGKNTDYYLYRAWDEDGERAVLREKEISPTAGPTNPQSGYIFVRKLTGECEALTAFDALNREVRERNRKRRGAAAPQALPPAPARPRLP